ncbi:MAG: helix-turn-helix transcriptional regulator [Pseudomonadota bacterium]|jgi:DNA-binding transcriptional ArsR family regulator|nr:helix-turn-helix transcriptional regulator [Pseudomonadota bacterium]
MSTGLSNIARLGALVGDPVRAAILAALMDGSERPAGELATRAGASPQAASAHLKLLLDGGLLAVSARGRHRYYCLRDADVAHAIETLSFTANLARRKTAYLEPALKQVRRCYDHIAGALGVAICDSLILRGRIIAGSDGFAISATGYEWLARFDLSPPRTIRRALVRPCLDWSEGRPHVAGWLGAALCERLETARGFKRNSVNRGLTVTPKGRTLLAEYFGLEWRLLGTP